MSRMTNADVLEKLNIVVPNESFNCGITFAVMDYPVIDPTTLNDAAKIWLAATPEKQATLHCGNFKEASRYDRESLIRLMNDDSGKSPTTRLPFTKEQLIPDTVLKAEIDAFMHPYRIEVIKVNAENVVRYDYFQRWLLFSPKGMAIASVVSMLVNALNAVEDLQSIKDVVERMNPAQLSILFSTSETLPIQHWGNLNIERTGTMLQMALYGDDEDIVGYLKTVMDPEAFECQSKKVFREALSSEKQAELDAANASAVEYYDAMQTELETFATDFCSHAFAFNPENSSFSVTEDSIDNFREMLLDYVTHNPVHNPYIMCCLYKLYSAYIMNMNKLEHDGYNYEVSEDSEDEEDPDSNDYCFFALEVIGYAQALSSARWLQHYTCGILYASGRVSITDYPEADLWRRSFMCHAPNEGVNIRSLILSGELWDNGHIDIFGGFTRMERTPGGVGDMEIIINKKREIFRNYYADNAGLRPLV